MRKHLTPGTVLGIVAVVFACTGSATAGVLITSNSIKDGTIQAREIKKGTISTDRLASSVRTQLAKAGTPGPAGPVVPRGPTTTVQGSAPTPGKEAPTPQKDGAPAAGKAGKDGFKPVHARRDLTATAGWNFVGGGGASPYPTASFAGGELRLQGGFDATTPRGAIGLVPGRATTPRSAR